MKSNSEKNLLERKKNLWNIDKSKKIIKEIQKMGFKGDYPEELEDQKKLLENLKQIKVSSPIENSINRKLIIEQITRYNWKKHEVMSLEQLLELRTALTEYFRIFKESYDHECDVNPSGIKEYEIEELKIINKDFEKRVLENKGVKKIQDTIWDEKIITIPELKRIEIKKEIKQWVITDMDKIPFEDLPLLSDAIESIKKYNQIPLVLDLNDARLVLLNCEIKEYGGIIQKNISDARKYLKCLESKKAIMNKFPELILSDNCEEIIRIYSEKVMLKDYVQNTIFTQEWVENELKMLEIKSSSGDQLSLNNP